MKVDLKAEKIGDEVRSLADEVPFDIPDSWEWVRIRSLGEIVRGSGIKRNETVQQGLPCVRYGELYTTYQTSFTSAVSFIAPDLYEKCTTGKAIFNPLLLGSIFVIILLSVLNISYADYKVSAAPVNYLLLPATISLAIPLYEKWDLLKENAAAIIAGISVGTLVSLGSALALALALGLTREQYATLLPKSVTTAISMDVAAELGGIAALTGAIVILTGIAGNLLAEVVCKLFHITDPIAKGVGIGTSAHAVGTSKALQMGEVEGAMSGLSIAVAGVLTAVLCPLFVSFIQ